MKRVAALLLFALVQPALATEFFYPGALPTDVAPPKSALQVAKIALRVLGWDDEVEGLFFSPSRANEAPEWSVQLGSGTYLTFAADTMRLSGIHGADRAMPGSAPLQGTDEEIMAQVWASIRCLIGDGDWRGTAVTRSRGLVGVSFERYVRGFPVNGPGDQISVKVAETDGRLKEFSHRQRQLSAGIAEFRLTEQQAAAIAEGERRPTETLLSASLGWSPWPGEGKMRLAHRFVFEPPATTRGYYLLVVDVDGMTGEVTTNRPPPRPAMTADQIAAAIGSR